MDNDADIAKVQESLRHANIATTFLSEFLPHPPVYICRFRTAAQGYCFEEEGDDYL